MTPPLGMNEELTPTPAGGFLAGRRKWAILLSVLVVAAVGVAVWPDPPSSPSPTNQANGSTTTTTSTTNHNGSLIQRVTVPLSADADKDGLPDQRETELGTNTKLADSDGDGLNDYEEVEVYATDPRQQDTDRDGFPDGEEVRTGNNPKGTGGLRDLPQTLSNINAQ